MGDSINRRQAVSRIIAGGAILAGLGSIGCTRHRYIRPPGELRLGTVEELLYRKVHLRKQAVLVYRDVDGWSVLSARCTYVGCDLTYQEPILLCHCCGSRYDLEGRVYDGFSATVDLPWIDVYYREGHLYANPGVIRDKSFRFTTPDIESAVRELKKRIKNERPADEIEIPKALLGKPEDEDDIDPGPMFIDDSTTAIKQLQKMNQ